MKKKIIIISCACILLLAITVLSGIRIYKINKQYPDPTRVVHQIGEQIKGGSTSLCALSYRLVDGNEIKELAPTYEDVINENDGVKLTGDQRRILLVNLKITNNTSQDQRVVLAQICAESLIWSNAIDRDLYMVLNANKGSPMRIELNPNEEMEVVLPYLMYDFQFMPKDWKSIDSRKFDLSLSAYPTKNIIQLN